jgi:hypothetical protein
MGKAPWAMAVRKLQGGIHTRKGRCSLALLLAEYGRRQGRPGTANAPQVTRGEGTQQIAAWGLDAAPAS